MKSDVNESKMGSQNSCNSLSFHVVAIEGMINKAIREDNSIPMQPTKKGLDKLFQKLNLYVPTLKIVDCLVYCRGKAMEDAPPEDFEMEKLVGWFELNLRTLKHLDSGIISDK